MTKPKRKAHHHRKPEATKAQGEIVTSVPARLINEGRKQSTHVIDTLAKTATALATSEGAAGKVDIIERLWAMQKDAEDRQADREFSIAKVAVAMALPAIPKTKVREFTDKFNQVQSSRYSDLDDIEGVLDPICRKNGFSKEYSSDPSPNGQLARQVLTIRHVAGHKEVYYGPYMPLDSTGSKNNSQAAGSTAKYGRRYALIGAFNIFHADEDNDGAGDDAGQKSDKFSERVKGEATAKEGGPGPYEQTTTQRTSESTTLGAEEAANILETKLRNTQDVKKRGEILMKNIGILQALENAGNKQRSDDLRKLAEGGAQ